MTAKETLENLIADLRRSTSGVEQLKIIAQAWSTVRKLSRKERVELATHVGLEEAKTLLERFGQPGGVSPARLAEAVLKAERAHPGELNRLLSDLRDSEKRAGALRESVRLAEAALVGVEESTSKPEAEAPAPTSLPKPVLKEAADRRDAPPVPPVPAPKKIDQTAKTGPPPATVPALSQPVLKTRPEPAAPPSPSEKEPLDSRPSEEPTEEFAEQPTPKPAARAAPSTPAIQTPPKPSRPSAGPDLALDSEPTLMGRFRRLNRMARQGLAAQAKVETILQAFPAGWPRRRALAALIRTGALTDVDRFLDAVAQFENPRDEFWCVSALAQSRNLTPQEQEKLLSGVSHNSSRRLLKRISG